MMDHGSLFTSEIFSKGYGFAPKMVMIDTELTSEAKTIYCYLSSYSGAGMSSYPSIELMLNHLGMSRNRYFKHRKLLIERGYISIEKKRVDGDFSNNVYILNSEPTACIQNATMRNATMQNATMQNATTNSNSLKSNSINNNSDKKDLCEKDSHDSKKATKLEQIRKDFEVIWKEYPPKRRKDKEKCFVRYRNAIKDGDTRENVYRGLMAYKKEIAENGTPNEFIRLSSTWFNRNWNDHIELEKIIEKEKSEVEDYGWN